MLHQYWPDYYHA